MDDRELADRFRAGDEAAVRVLYERFGRPVHSVAYTVLRDRELAAEAVQQTFLKAWRAAATFDPDRDMAPWLYAIARRVAIDIYRREARRPGTAPLENGDATVIPLTFERTWEAWEIRTALQQLDAGEREVVRLAHFEGFTHPEIAARLGIPVGTVKSRSNRAHRRLASLLGHLAGTAG